MVCRFLTFYTQLTAKIVSTKNTGHQKNERRRWNISDFVLKPRIFRLSQGKGNLTQTSTSCQCARQESAKKQSFRKLIFSRTAHCKCWGSAVIHFLTSIMQVASAPMPVVWNRLSTFQDKKMSLTSCWLAIIFRSKNLRLSAFIHGRGSKDKSETRQKIVIFAGHSNGQK